MERAKKLWNLNFTILWQGQLISDFGNTAFGVALGFWVLASTTSAQYPAGNTALMGIIEACFALPAVFLGPMAGALADRFDRKRIIVMADLARGVLFSLMGLLLLFEVFPFWMIYPLAILAGTAGSFFSPAVNSALPDIVPTESLSKANSARSLSQTVTQLLGTSLGGMLFALLKAPALILFNGLTFLYASITQLFMRVPAHSANAARKNIFADILTGIKYTFGNRGIRTLVLTGMIINFLAVCGMTLMTPLFNSTEGFGVQWYGYVMGTLTAGMVAGMVIFSIVKIKPSQRASVFCLSVLVMVLAMAPIGLIRTVQWLLPLAFVAGLTNAVVNVLLQTIMQTTVAAENRGKVFGILGTVMGSLQPVAMAVSGVLALHLGIRPTMTVAFLLLVVAALPMLFDRHFKAFLNTNPIEEGERRSEDQPALPADIPVVEPAAD